MLMKVWLPTLVSAVVLFFASFLSWMVVMLHKQDWVKADNEDELLDAIRQLGLKPGRYMFPSHNSTAELITDEYKEKLAPGPVGVFTVFGKVSMGRNLGLTFLYFAVCSFCLGYLTTVAFPDGAETLQVFRLVSTAGLLTFLASFVQHAIWFHTRVVGHVIESIAYSLMVGGIFAGFWSLA